MCMWWRRRRRRSWLWTCHCCCSFCSVQLQVNGCIQCLLAFASGYVGHNVRDFYDNWLIIPFCSIFEDIEETVFSCAAEDRAGISQRGAAKDQHHCKKDSSRSNHSVHRFIMQYGAGNTKLCNYLISSLGLSTRPKANLSMDHFQYLRYWKWYTWRSVDETTLFPTPYLSSFLHLSSCHFLCGMRLASFPGLLLSLGMRLELISSCLYKLHVTLLKPVESL